MFIELTDEASDKFILNVAHIKCIFKLPKSELTRVEGEDDMTYDVVETYEQIRQVLSPREVG